MDIAAWLRELGLERYAQVFQDSEIEPEILAELTDEDFKELGIPLGPRRKLARAIAALSAQAATPPDHPAAVDSPATPPHQAERRQLTVMFVDLVGSTALAARLDPEDMGQVIRSYREICSEVVERWDGYVAKYMGDGVLAYFGWPQAHEDEAERAVRAGLEVADGVAKLNTPAEKALAARIGIATGLVMVGELSPRPVADQDVAVRLHRYPRATWVGAGGLPFLDHAAALRAGRAGRLRTVSGATCQSRSRPEGVGYRMPARTCDG